MPRRTPHAPASDAQPQPYMFDAATPGGAATLWGLVNPNILHGAVTCVTARGDGLILSYTADGGALSITVLAGANKPRFYPATVEEAERVLNAIADWATDNPGK